jgi:hypothetical protein
MILTIEKEKVVATVAYPVAPKPVTLVDIAHVDVASPLVQCKRVAVSITTEITAGM